MNFEKQFGHVVKGCLDWIAIIKSTNSRVSSHFEGIVDIEHGLVEFQYSTICMGESEQEYESLPLEVLMIEDTNKRFKALKAIWNRELQIQKEGQARLEAELAENNKKRDLETLKALKEKYPNEKL